MIVHHLRYHIWPSHGSSWSWEVITQAGEVIADGVADNDIRARASALVAGLKCTAPNKQDKPQPLN